MNRVIALAALIGLAMLGGCRTAPVAPAKILGPGAGAPWSEQRAALEKVDRYALAGKVAVAANGQGFSASLRYDQQPARADLALDGPLGIGGLRVALAGEDLEITNSKGETLDGVAARAELERRLGFELPLDQLRWWLLGLPAPGASTLDLEPVTGEIRGFMQNGWRVAINTRAPALGFSLPQRLTAERGGGVQGGARLKLFVERWE
ncbi:MAG TPA: lipoprotein insertase outer membrane protein LolB [Steroidobacteraceae bacterium]|nr:lipoprotein insertase outer membrane protein LolB [Steroidobacteraceae bacterium]